MAGRPLAAVGERRLAQAGRPRTGRRRLRRDRIARRRSSTSPLPEETPIRGTARSSSASRLWASRPAADRSAATVRKRGIGSWSRATFGGSIAASTSRFSRAIDEATRAARRPVHLHAMIDVSDGLAADLYHILDESGAGAVVRADQRADERSRATTGGRQSPPSSTLSATVRTSSCSSLFPRRTAGACWQAAAVRHAAVTHRRDHRRANVPTHRSHRSVFATRARRLGPSNLTAIAAGCEKLTELSSASNRCDTRLSHQLLD